MKVVDFSIDYFGISRLLISGWIFKNSLLAEWKCDYKNDIDRVSEGGETKKKLALSPWVI